MNSFIHADIFFFIATIALVLISAAFITLIVISIFMVQEVRSYVSYVSEKSEQAWEDWKGMSAKLSRRFGIVRILKKLAERFL